MYTAKSIHHYNDHNKKAVDYGYWKVSTAGDCEGRTSKQLGIHIGEAHKLAFILQEHAYDSLEFEHMVHLRHSTDNIDKATNYSKYKYKTATVYTNEADILRRAVADNSFVRITSDKSDRRIELSCQSDKEYKAQLKRAALEKAEAYLSEEELKILGVKLQ